LGNFRYTTGNGQVDIVYSKRKCDAGWDVPAETVLRLEVHSNSTSNKSIDDLKLSKKKLFVSVDDAFFANWTDPDAGLQYYFRSYDQFLDSIKFIPKRSDNDKRCDGYPPYKPEGYHYTMERYRFYYSKYPSFQMPYVIDTFLLRLTDAPQYTGYMVVYFDPKLPVKKYLARLSQIKDFVFRIRKTSPDKLQVIEGGLRHENEVEFYLLPKDWVPPAPDPTLPSPQFMKKRRGM
jgi:hypothetical protein